MTLSCVGQIRSADEWLEHMGVRALGASRVCRTLLSKSTLRAGAFARTRIRARTRSLERGCLDVSVYSDAQRQREGHVMESRGDVVIVHRERHRICAADLHDLVVGR